MAVTYPTVIYGQGSTYTITPDLISTDYGDGMQKVVPNGINNQLKSGSLEHPLLTIAQAATLRTFLLANMTGQIVQILNKMDDPTGGTTMNVYILGYSQASSGSQFTFTVKFQETPQT